MSETGDERNYEGELSGNPQRNGQPKYWNLKIFVDANHPELLQGLDAWLQLGLINQGQVKKLARNYLSCDLAIPAVISATSEAAEPDPVSNPPQVLASANPAHSFQRIWQSFLDELSIRWLLFLGIFLVLVSSGVLAASQWENFPKLGQYLVLLLYTLGFWGIGFWTGKQNDLKLTAQTLSAIAICLIPLNFWAISHLGLSRNPGELGIVVAAIAVLSAISYLTFQRYQSLFLLRLSFWILSFLQLGWQIPQLAPLSIYGGIGMIGLIHQQLLSSRRKYPLKYPLRDLLFVLVAWISLLARNLIASSDSLVNYSLAIAIFTWLMGTIYLSQAKKIKVIALKHQSIAITNAFLFKVGNIGAIIFFLYSWLVSVNAGLVNSSLYFWQTLGISALAMQLLNQRLRLYKQKDDLTLLFLIGLQAFYLCKELIPPGLRNPARELLMTASKTEYFPEAVFGVTLFPYLLFYVLVATWLYKRKQTKLALHSEYLTLILGIVLTCLSLANPTWRSLNLLLSTLTLGYVALIRRPIRRNLVYFTHLFGLITLVNAIAVIFPDLNQTWWGVALLALMFLEWSFYLVQIRQRNPVTLLIKQSCWYFGLFLAAISYSCLAEANIPAWSLLWLITPLMLSLIGKYTANIRLRRLATTISCVALLFSQLLLFSQWETRLLGLAIATGVMFINAFNYRRLFVTLIHLGFAIALVGSTTALIFSINSSDYRHWLSIGSLIIFLLYLLRQWLLRISEAPQFGYISQRTAFGILGVGRETQNFKLINKYLRATNYWAIALVASELVIISALYFLLPLLKLDQGLGHYLVTTGLLFTGIFWCYRATPSNMVLYTLAWLWAVFTGGILRLFVSSSFVLATSNIIFGLIALVIVVLIANSNTPWAKLNLAYLPLVYAALGVFWRLFDFNAYTGLLTLGAALILINTQQRNQQVNRFTKYLAIAAISGGIYELVIYQIQGRIGANPAQALTILSLATLGIAFGYHLLAWWYRQKGLGTTLAQIKAIAHLHWGIAGILQLAAMGIIWNNLPDSLVFKIISIATGFCLGVYALLQGRIINTANSSEVNSQPNHDWWVGVGFGEIVATLIYGRLIISQLRIFDPWFAVFSCLVSLLIYLIPWSSLGWRSTPWQRISLILPIFIVLITARDLADLSLLITAIFYLGIAYNRHNIRWSYLSLGLLNWFAIKLIGQSNPPLILIAGIICLSILYLAQFEPSLQTKRQPRHYLRVLGSSVFCLVALWEHPGVIPGAIAFGFIFVGLGLRIRAFLFTGTIALILTVLHQLVILLFTYSFLKWVVGLVTGISSIAIAAGFENKRAQIIRQLRTYGTQLQSWS